MLLENSIFLDFETYINGMYYLEPYYNKIIHYKN